MKHGIDELKKLLYKFKTMPVSEYTELYNASLSRDQIKVFDDNKPSYFNVLYKEKV